MEASWKPSFTSGHDWLSSFHIQYITDIARCSVIVWERTANTAARIRVDSVSNQAGIFLAEKHEHGIWVNLLYDEGRFEGITVPLSAF